MRAKIKEFWQKYESRMILIAGLILVAVISFEAGILQGRKIPQNPIIIEKPAENQSLGEVSPSNSPEASKTAQEAANDAAKSNTPDQKCAFVGSKNSNKYHLPTCRYAKNINAENLVCFSSEDDATAKGYLPDKNCIK